MSDTEGKVFNSFDDIVIDMIVDNILKNSSMSPEEALERTKSMVKEYMSESNQDFMKSEVQFLIQECPSLAICYEYTGKPRWSCSSIVNFIETHELSAFVRKEDFTGIVNLHQEGGGEDCEFIFGYKGSNYQYEYNYYSHYGYEFYDGDLTRVFPRTVETIQWFTSP